MNLKNPFLFALALIVYSSGHAQPGAEVTTVIMRKAYQQAAKENKKVFVIFHASWCVWCRKLDSSMNDLACGKFFRDNYVVCHLTVDESKDRKNLETEGADAFRAKYHGEQAGLPFWLILDKKGNLLADSRMRKPGEEPDAPGDNMGCPASREEVAYFISLLKRTASPDEKQSAVIAERFSRNQ